MYASTLLEPTERVPIRESALAWLETHDLRLEQMTPEQLHFELGAYLLDRDVCEHGYDDQPRCNPELAPF